MLKTLIMSVVLSISFPSKEDISHIEQYRKTLPQTLAPGVSVFGASIDPFEGSIFYEISISAPMDILLISIEGQYEMAKLIAKSKCKDFYSQNLFIKKVFFRYLVYYNNKFLYTFTVSSRNCNIKEA